MLWCPNMLVGIFGSVSAGFSKKIFKHFSGHDWKQRWNLRFLYCEKGRQYRVRTAVTGQETVDSYTERKDRLWNDLPTTCFCRGFTLSVIRKWDSSRARLPEALSCARLSARHISCAAGRTNNTFAWNWTTSLFEFYSMQMWRKGVHGHVRLRLVYLLRCTDTCRSPISPTQSSITGWSFNLRPRERLSSGFSMWRPKEACGLLIHWLSSTSLCSCGSSSKQTREIKSGNCVSLWQRSKLQLVCWFTIRKQCLIACPPGNLIYGGDVTSDRTEVQWLAEMIKTKLTRFWQKCLWWLWGKKR